MLNKRGNGGRSSYKSYKKLREKTQSICLELLKNKKICSGKQLCELVAVYLEINELKLLSTFSPYKKAMKGNRDWITPTFYNWCNKIYKLNRER